MPSTSGETTARRAGAAARAAGALARETDAARASWRFGSSGFADEAALLPVEGEIIRRQAGEPDEEFRRDALTVDSWVQRAVFAQSQASRRWWMSLDIND